MRVQRFADAPHVELLKVHPQAYNTAIDAFIKACGVPAAGRGGGDAEAGDDGRS